MQVNSISTLIQSNGNAKQYNCNSNLSFQAYINAKGLKWAMKHRPRADHEALQKLLSDAQSWDPNTMWGKFTSIIFKATDNGDSVEFVRTVKAGSGTKINGMPARFSASESSFNVDDFQKMCDPDNIAEHISYVVNDAERVALETTTGNDIAKNSSNLIKKLISFLKPTKQ